MTRDIGPIFGQCQVMVDKYVLMQRLCDIPSNVECGGWLAIVSGAAATQAAV